MKILVDEMYDGLDLELIKLGYDAYSVKKLKMEEEKLGHDFNVISHAKEHGMVLVTGDTENGEACRANGFPCVFVTKDKIFGKIIVEELKDLETRL
jgi:predicted nuclease of predicted toxin-antitoxin system